MKQFIQRTTLKVFLLFIGLIFPGVLLFAQLNTTCPNSNFATGTFANWVGSYGNFNNPALHAGFDTNTVPPYPFANFQCYSCNPNPPNINCCPPLHSLIAAPGTWDPNTGDSLKSVFNGEPYSTRLGHTVGGAHSARLKYSVTVTNSTYLFIYRYAVILQNPAHTAAQQPSFTIEVQNPLGQVIDSACGYYYIYAHLVNNQPLPTWHKHNATGGQVIWKEWTTVGMSLANYIGQTVTIVFTIKDCSPGGHFGYAYLSTYCNYLTVQTAMCEGDTSATLTAPPGFSYLWSNGDTTASITVPHPVTGDTYSCTLTAINGCTVTITQILTYTVIHANFTHGNSCAQHPTQFNDSSYVNQNFVTNWKWYFGDGGTSTGNGNPTYTYALPGTYDVTLIAFSTEGCSDTITKQITVAEIPLITNDPMYETICSKSSTNVTLTSNMTPTLFTWTATSKAGTTTGYSNNTTNPTTIINQVLNNTGLVMDTIIYNITGHHMSCDGIPVDYKVAVKPLPVLTNAIRMISICTNSPTNINLQSNNDSTFFKWVCTASSLNLLGYANNTTTPVKVINQTLVNTGFNIDTVYYHIIPQSYGCFGDTTIYKVAVYPPPNVSNSPMNKSICSNTSTNITLTSNVPGTTFAWTCTPSSGNVGGYANGSGAYIGQTLINSGFGNETVVYHITPTANGCAGQIFDYTVTVYPVPTLSNSPATKQICSNTATNITLTSNVTGTLFTWTATGSSPQVSGYSDNNTPSIAINDILVNTGYSIETVTYHITPHANGCDGNTWDYIVTVYPVPDVIFTPAVPSICAGQTTNIALTSNVSGTTFSWTASASSPSVTGYSAGAGNTIAQILNTPGFVVETVTYTVTPVANGCSGPTFNVTVTINPKPHVTNNPMRDSICSGQITNVVLISSCLNTNFTWTASLTTGNVTGFSNGSGNLIAQTLTNTLGTLGSVKYTVHIIAGTCIGNDTDYYVYVKPRPLLSNTPPSKAICNNTSTNVLLTSNVAGASFTWTASGSSPQVTGYTTNNTPSITINDVLHNSGFNIETVTYHLTPYATGCYGPITDYTLTVYPTPDLTNTPLNKSQCNNLGTNITLTSHVTGTLFTWTATGSTPNITGYANNNTPSITINDVLVNAGTNIETVTYHITPHANNCDGILYNYTVTVYPTAQVSTSPLAQTICTNTAISVNLTSTVAGSTYAWTCTASSPNLSGFSNGSGNLISQTLSNSGYTIETVTYHITPTANGCSGLVANYVVTVNPKPDVSNNPLSAQICSGTSPNIALTSHVAGANFSWTATGSSPNIIGYGPGSGLVINQILTNTGFNIESVTYHITPTANGCTGNLFDFIVSIVSVPDVYFNPPAQTICSAGTTNIQVLSHVVGATFTWTASASSPNLSGYSGGSGPLIGQTITNSGNTIETVTYTATPAAFGCPTGPTQNVVATINPKPVITNATRTQQICSAQNFTITPQSTVTGTTYSWIASGSSPNVTGFGNGTGLSFTQTLTNSGFNIETVTYIITPTANSCPGDTAHFQVIVFPVADVYFTPSTQAICPLQTCNITNNSHVAGTTYAWTASGSTGNVSGFSAGSGNLIQQILNNSSYNIETVTYHVTPTANNCIGTAGNVIVTVNPNPSVSFTICWDPVTTTDAQPIRLKGGIPLNGVFSGTGVSSGIFYPLVAGVGTFTISYSYSNSYGCNGNSTQSIIVVSPPGFSCGNSLTDVRDSKTYATAQIGTQCWMAANLDYGNYMTGALTQRDNCIPEKFCYNDNISNCSTSGGLYQWDELMKYSNVAADQGLCPPAWHVPSENEWNTLFAFYISNGFAGSPLKYTGYSGFDAFLTGVRFKNVSWNFNNFAVFFWSSTSRGSFKAWAHGMNTYNPSVSKYPAIRNNAFSARCIKD